jgi:hypothetical protein
MGLSVLSIDWPMGGAAGRAAKVRARSSARARARANLARAKMTRANPAR